MIENTNLQQDAQQDSKISKIKKNIEKKFSFNLTSERKQEIAEKIIEDSHIDKLYWSQLVVACMLATL